MFRDLPVRTALTLATGAAVIALGVAACGSSGGSTQVTASTPASQPKSGGDTNPPGDIPDNQAYVAFKPPGGAITVKVPEGWAQRTSVGAVVFSDKLNAIRIETRSAATAPTVASVRRQDVAELARTVKGFTPGTVSAVKRNAGTAVRIKYLATAPANPVTGKAGLDAVERYLFFHRGKEAILTLSGPKGADNVDPWRLVTNSVHWSA